MNVKLLRKVKQHILAEPGRLYMSSYIRSEKNGPIGRPFPKCGTAACIAGWTCILGLNLKDPHEFWLRNSVGEKAAELLGINKHEAYRLFEPAGWPNEFDHGLDDDGKEKTAQIAAKRIEHFIRTKGAE